MNLDTFEYPVNEEQTAIHIKANRIGKMRKYTMSKKGPKINATNAVHNHHHENNIPQGVQCVDCGRRATDCPHFDTFERQESIRRRYGVYGPSYVIYLGFIRKIAMFMLFCTIVFALPMFIINLTGNVCQNEGACTNKDVIYNWSLYNILGSNPGSLPNTALWLLFCLFMIVFNVLLRKYALQQYRRLNARNTTDSDYSLLLRRLPPQTKAHDVRGLIQSRISPKKGELNPQSTQNLQSFQIRDVIMIYKADKMIQAHEKQVKKFKKAAKKADKGKGQPYAPHPLLQSVQFANAAIVRFNDKVSNNWIADTAHSSLFQHFKQYLCVFYNPKTQYKLNNQQISIQNAPHPTDMNWQNFGYTEGGRICRKFIFNLASIAILFISAGVSIALSYWIQVITNNKNGQPVYLTVIIVLITLGFNRIIMAIVMWTTRKQRLDTKSDEQSEQITLIVVQQSLALGFFSIFAPIIVKLPTYVADKTTKSSSFPMVMFVTILIQGLLTNFGSFVANYFEISQKISIFLNKKRISIKTQTQANQKWKGTQVPFVSNYSFNVKMVWFGFLYGVVTPISIFISMISMFLFLLFQKILFNSKYSIPYYAGPRINDTMIDLFDWTPLLIGLFNLYLYQTSANEREFSQDGRVHGLIAAMIVIGAINLLVPWKILVKKFTKQYDPERNILFQPQIVDVTYQQANPSIRPIPNVIYREDIPFQLAAMEYLKPDGTYGQTNSPPQTTTLHSAQRVIHNQPISINLH